MPSNFARIQDALGPLREAAEKANEATGNQEPYHGLLEVVAALTPDSMEMALATHVKLLGEITQEISTCGYVDAEVAAVINGLKELIESIDGRWYYEESRWHHHTEREERMRVLQAEMDRGFREYQAGLEVAK
jgi:hypothetical protein